MEIKFFDWIAEKLEWLKSFFISSAQKAAEEIDVIDDKIDEVEVFVEVTLPDFLKMTKQAIVDYARDHLNLNIDMRLKKQEIIDEIVSSVNKEK